MVEYVVHSKGNEAYTESFNDPEQDRQDVNELEHGRVSFPVKWDMLRSQQKSAVISVDKGHTSDQNA